MEKKSKWLFKRNLSPVTLYIDDISEILEKMEHVCKEIKLGDEKYKYESLEELKKHRGNKVKEIEICGYYPFLTLEIGKYVNISTSGETEAVIGLWYSLKDYLKRKSPWYSKILTAGSWGISSLLLLSLLPLVLITFPKIKEPYFNVMAISGFFYILSFLVRLKGSTIYLERKHQISNFWGRNRDKIIMLLIGSILTLLGALFMKFVFNVSLF